MKKHYYLMQRVMAICSTPIQHVISLIFQDRLKNTFATQLGTQQQKFNLIQPVNNLLFRHNKRSNLESQPPERKLLELNHQLAKAIEIDNIFEAFYCILQGANPNTQDGKGNTLLHVLITKLHENVSYKLEANELALLYPALDSNKNSLSAMIKFLTVHCRANLLKNIYGNTPLHDFVLDVIKDITHKELEGITNLLIYNRNIRELNLKNKAGVSAWMLSILHNTPQSSILAKIPEIQINCRIKKFYGYDYDFGRSEKLLKKVKALWGTENKFYQGWTDLMVACLFENYQALEGMLQRSDLQLTNDEYFVSDYPALMREILPGETPLHYAVVYNDVDLLHYLIQKLGPNSLYYTNNQRHTILHKAAQLKCHDILQLLLSIDKLREILFPNELTDEAYRAFVNASSWQGMAANCYECWNCTRKYQIEEDYQAFIDCAHYNISAIDQSGSSLIHILAENGYAKLLLYTAAKRQDACFNMKNSQGYTPLQVALESDHSSAPAVIEVLVKLSHDKPDITPNHYQRFYPNIRQRLADVIEESLYQSGIEGLNIEKLLDVYLKQTPFSSQALFQEEKLEVRLKSNQLSEKKLLELALKVKEYLSYYESYETGEIYIYPENSAELQPKDAELYEIIKNAYEVEFNDEFCFILNDAIIEVSIEDRRKTKAFYPIKIDYKDLINLMGDKWTYSASHTSTDTNDENYTPHSKDYIFYFPEVPLLYLAMEKIKEESTTTSETEISKTLAWQKFLALLEFPHIENLNVDHPEMGLISLEQYATGAMRKQLSNKLQQQALSYGSIPSFIQGLENKQKLCFKDRKNINNTYREAINLFKNSALAKFTVEEVKQLQSLVGSVCPKLNDLKLERGGYKKTDFLQEEIGKIQATLAYIADDKARTLSGKLVLIKEPELCVFAETFAKRIRQFAYKKRNYTSNHMLNLITALAELLEADSTCVAVCFLDKFVIASNFTSTTDSSDPHALRIKLAELARDLFSYFRLVAQGKRDLEIAIKVLSNIMKEHLKSITEYTSKGNVKVKDFFDKNLYSIIEFAYTNYKEIQSAIVIDEHESDKLTKKLLTNYFTKNFAALQDIGNTSQILQTISRMCGNLLMVEESILTANPKKKLPLQVLNLLQSNQDIAELYTVLENPRLIHAEVAIIERIIDEIFKNQMSHVNFLVGISKVCCPHCTLFVQSMPNFPDMKLYIHTKGTHNTHSRWEIPEIFFSKTEVLSAFLGGTNSTLHKLFVNFNEEQRLLCFTIIAHIYELQKKEGYEEIRKILNTREVYSRAPHSVKEIDLTTLQMKQDTKAYVQTNRDVNLNYFNAFIIEPTDIQQIDAIIHDNSPIKINREHYLNFSMFSNAKSRVVTRQSESLTAREDLTNPLIFSQANNAKKHPQTSAKISILTDPQSGTQFSRHAVSADGDCGYTAFGITRTDAYQALSNRLDEVCTLLQPAIREALLTESFIDYLKNYEYATGGLLTIFRQYQKAAREAGNIDVAIQLLYGYADDLAILQAYLDYDICDKQIDAGWSHPAILQALAQCQGLELFIWQIGSEQQVLPHAYYAHYRSTHASERVNLLVVNDNHFERLTRLDPVPIHQIIPKNGSTP
jgi:ankyrin repeat protein